MDMTEFTDYEYENGIRDEYGVLYSSDGKKLLSYSEELVSYKVKEGTEVICDKAFYRCYLLKEIHMPDSIKSIGKEAFYDCLLLSDIRLSNQLLYIGTGCFKNCKNLQFIHFPPSLEILESSIFSGCVSLQQITLPHKVNVIPSFAFYECQSLKKCNCESSVQSVGERAFANCPNLQSIVLKSVEEKRIIDNKEDIKFDKQTIDSGIEAHAFDNCFSLLLLKVPEEITYIGKRAFRHCFSLTEIEFGSRIVYVHEIAFEGCRRLKKMIVPDNGTQTYEAIKEFGSTFVIDYKPLQQKNDFRIETFILGEKFPWFEYAYPGDHITPVINSESFDVVISLKDIAWKEKRAFSMVMPVISIFIYKEIPFIIANFDDTLVVQFSINILKMKLDSIDHWLKSDYNLVRFFLLEGNDGSLVSYIHLTLPHMKELKKTIAIQRQLSKEQIDSIIEEGESKFSQYEMIANATYVDTIQ